MPTADLPYAELHCHSTFSFLDGASQPEELALQAAELGLEALALTDHDNLCGALDFAQAARDCGVRPITGAELTVRDGARALPRDRAVRDGSRAIATSAGRSPRRTAPTGCVPELPLATLARAGRGADRAHRLPTPRRARPRRSRDRRWREDARCATRSGPSGCASS